MRLDTLLCAVITCASIALLTFNAAAPPERDEASSEGETLDELASLVEDYSELTNLADDEIVHVEVVFYENDKVFLDHGIAGERRVTFRSDEEHGLLLYMFKTALLSPFRKVSKTGAVGGSRPSVIVGKVTVGTKRGGEFMFGITDSGFSLNSEQPDIRRNFFSWRMAKILDDIFYKERRVHMPCHLMMKLSGVDEELEARQGYLMAPRRWRGVTRLPDDFPKEPGPKHNWMMTWRSDEYMRSRAEYLRKNTAEASDLLTTEASRLPF